MFASAVDRETKPSCANVSAVCSNCSATPFIARAIARLSTGASPEGKSPSRLLRSMLASCPAATDVARSIATSRSSMAAFTSPSNAETSSGLVTTASPGEAGFSPPRALPSRSCRSLRGSAGGTAAWAASSMACAPTAPCRRANFVSALRIKLIAMNDSSYMLKASEPSTRCPRIEWRPRSTVQTTRRKQPSTTFVRIDTRIRQPAPGVSPKASTAGLIERSHSCASSDGSSNRPCRLRCRQRSWA